MKEHTVHEVNEPVATSPLALNARFTTNGIFANYSTVYMWREQVIIEWSRRSDLGEWPLIMLVNLVNSWLYVLTVTTRVISSGEFCCCLLPQCEALRSCGSGFPIATGQLVAYKLDLLKGMWLQKCFRVTKRWRRKLGLETSLSCQCLS